ncbi:MAG: hypothetical protein Athens101410_41 [Parcubacteria group bacterium Athens1014_10]|nr:MAG: hypothetical protein Athens101410_41 [Parcubacteria group bacterium Athens1014_10]TSD06067.1 MAG: hypothetical protein Athens071412_41 [Parcubacteria group bacterium Athens0714_12]
MFQQISPYSIPVGIASIGFLFLSSLVYLKNKKSSVNINFAVFNFLIFVWLFSYAICYSTQNDKIAYFFAKTACVAVFLFVLFYFYNALYYGEMEREKEKVENMISFMPDGLILLDEKNKILHLNPKAKEILKMEDINKKDLSMEALVNYPFFTTFLSFIEKQKKLRETGKLEEALFLKDDHGNDLIYETTLSYSKELKGILIILRDITREKAVDKMKSEFISIAAHQLRTPLSAIKWVIKMILDGDTGVINAEQKNLLNKGYQSNERMIKLINDLLNVSRIDEGRFLYQFSEESLEKLIKEIINLINPLAKKNKIKIIFNKSAETLPKIKIDKEKIFLAIQNLVENAIRYSSNNSEVIISVKYDKIEKKAVVEVKDKGIGIPKNQQSRVFTKFFRENNITKTQTEGSGLGLFIVKNIIEAHKGKIWFESEEKKGSSFYFSLPLYNNKKL